MIILAFIIILIIFFRGKKHKVSKLNLISDVEKLDMLSDIELEEIFRKNLFLFNINYDKELNTENFNYLSENVKNFFIEFKEVKFIEENFILSLDEKVSYLIDIHDKTFLVVDYEGFDGHGYLLANQKNIINAVNYEGTDFINIEEKSIYYHIVTMLVLNKKIIL